MKSFQKGGTIYQINLRMFTTQGTLAAAEELLPHIAELGVEFVYLCPVAEADPDTRREFWSERQKTYGAENPRNPYRIRDYFKIDPEYGTDASLRSFVGKAHGLGLRVLLDLVYFHCGPTASLIDLVPEVFQKDENGVPVPGGWHFPRIDFRSAKLREYLWSNMEYFVREFNVDGYRVDVGDMTPLDFWEEGRRRIQAIDPDVFMLSEAEGKAEYFNSAFDCAYGFRGIHGLANLIRHCENKELGIDAKAYAEIIAGSLREVGPGHVLRGFSNHDISTDHRFLDWADERAKETAFVLCFTLDGYPFLYNGQEIADRNKHNMFYPAGHGWGVDWSRAFTKDGIRRMDLIRRFTALRKQYPELYDGSYRLISADESTIRFIRADHLMITVSFSGSPVELAVNEKVKEEIFQSGGVETAEGTLRLPPFGWIIQEIC